MIPNPFNRGRRLGRSPSLPSLDGQVQRTAYYERCPWWLHCGWMTPPFGTAAELAEWLAMAGWCKVDEGGRERWACDDCSARKGLAPTTEGE